MIHDKKIIHVKKMIHVKHSNLTDRTIPYAGEDFTLDATHPDHPELYRVGTPQLMRLHEGEDKHPCAECIAVRVSCDLTCGFGSVWVGAVTRLRIRMMEAQQ
jgi:hypothetical protein